MITTRLTEKLGITHPVISAPMAFASGGRLASAVSEAGGLGLIGGAYGDADWLEDQFREAGNSEIGCGFITWSLKKQPHLLDQVLAHKPRAVFLSFDDPEDFSRKIKDSGALLICQVQRLEYVRRAVECGADIIVAQGSEAGGHGIGGGGNSRGTFTLVPEIADWLAGNAPEVLLCAAGGIADGRGLAASLMLGADGVVVGSRFWASRESLAHPNLLEAAMIADGDATIRTSVVDVARNLDWPEQYSARVLRNDFSAKWHDDLDGLKAAGAEEADKWVRAWKAGDTRTANTFVGEVTGLINDIRPAAQILKDMVSEAARLMSARETAK